MTSNLLRSGNKLDRIIQLTPPGTSAIAVIRLIGPGVDQFLRDHFSRPARIGRTVHGDLFENREIIDDPLVARLDDRTVDINVHGGRWVVERVLSLAMRCGFDSIDNPGLLLPSDAVDATSAIEAEMLVWLPCAGTAQAVRLLLHQPVAWKHLLEHSDRTEIDRVLLDRSLHWMLNPPRVAIIGPPNVGKSSLANRLFGTDRSITADAPGTTRDWVGESANLDGLLVTLLDTPGIRHSDDAVEMSAITLAEAEIRSANLCVIVEDAQSPDDPVAAQFAKMYPAAIRVVNKVDLALPLPSADKILTSAKSNQGLDQLRAGIRHRFDCDPIELTKARCWTERQRAFLVARAEECPDKSRTETR